MNEAPRFEYDWTRVKECMSDEEAANKGYRWNKASERWQQLASVKNEAEQQPRFPSQPSQAVTPRPASEVRPNPNEDVLTFGKREEFYVRGGSAGEILGQLVAGLASFQPNPNVDNHQAYNGSSSPESQGNARFVGEQPVAPPPQEDALSDDGYIPGEVITEQQTGLNSALSEIQDEQEQREQAKAELKAERRRTRNKRYAKKLATTALGAQLAYGGLGYATGGDIFITPDNVQQSASNILDLGKNIINVGKTVGGVFG